MVEMKWFFRRHLSGAEIDNEVFVLRMSIDSPAGISDSDNSFLFWKKIVAKINIRVSKFAGLSQNMQ